MRFAAAWTILSPFQRITTHFARRDVGAMDYEPGVVSVGAWVEDLGAYKALRGLRKRGPGRLVEVSFYRSYEDLLDMDPPSYPTCLFIDPCIGTFPSVNVRAVEHLAKMFGTERIVFFLPAGRVNRLPPEISSFGVPFLVLGGLDDDPHSLLRVVARAECLRQLKEEFSEDGDRGDPFFMGSVVPKLMGWPPVDSPDCLAGQLAMSRRSLHRKLQDRGLVSPGRLVAYGRVLEGSSLWRLGVETVAKVASVIGVVDPSSLGHLCKQCTGTSARRFFEGRGSVTPFRWFAETVSRER